MSARSAQRNLRDEEEEGGGRIRESTPLAFPDWLARAATIETW